MTHNRRVSYVSCSKPGPIESQNGHQETNAPQVLTPDQSKALLEAPFYSTWWCSGRERLRRSSSKCWERNLSCSRARWWCRTFTEETIRIQRRSRMPNIRAQTSQGPLTSLSFTLHIRSRLWSFLMETKWSKTPSDSGAQLHHVSELRNTQESEQVTPRNKGHSHVLILIIFCVYISV